MSTQRQVYTYITWKSECYPSRDQTTQVVWRERGKTNFLTFLALTLKVRALCRKGTIDLHLLLILFFVMHPILSIIPTIVNCLHSVRFF